MTGVAQYQWNCSELGESGEWYIPGIGRDYGNNVLTTATAGDAVNMYRVQNTNCYVNQEVTAIDFCYQYSTTGEGEAVFNWTVLILEETNVFTIASIFIIESCPNSLSDADCVDIGGGKAKCCDREFIDSLNLGNNFRFGVTESSQGNTHGATLLGFHESLSEYRVDTVIISKEGQSIALGSTLPKQPVDPQRGLRMLWFVIGKLHIFSCWYLDSNA